MSRDCPKGHGQMRRDIGPADEPDGGGHVQIEDVWRCDTCGYEDATHRELWSETEIRRIVREVLRQRSVADLDARDRELGRPA